VSVKVSIQGDTSTHGGAPLDKGLSSNVFADGKPVAVTGVTGSNENDDEYNANPQNHPQGVASNQTTSAGSSTVFVNGNPIHRVGDARKDGATAGPGASDVFAG
jgi:uncharacterized Zn-binding protein involved in type VI secretion